MSKKKNQEQKEGQIVETKEEKFTRIMPKRVNAALDKMRLIKNIFASNGYHMTEEQYQKVYMTLEKALIEISSAYSGRTKSKEQTEKFEL